MRKNSEAIPREPRLSGILTSARDRAVRRGSDFAALVIPRLTAITRLALPLILAVFGLPAVCCADPFSQALPNTASASPEHNLTSTSFLLSLTLILFVAKLGGRIAVKLRQPEVLGELVAGVILGNLALVGIHTTGALAREPALDLLGELGVIFLLFEIGLETKLSELRAVGLSAAIAAVLGIVAPFLLGWITVRYFYPEEMNIGAAFVGAILTATSVGITARVLRDLKQLATPEARVILGAAVVDDVLGLVALALMTNIVNAANRGVDVSLLPILTSIGLAVGFLVGSVVAGKVLVPPLIRAVRSSGGAELELVASLILCFLLSYLATRAGLAPLIGAFAAGLILEGTGDESDSDSDECHLITLIAPLSLLCVPIFFVVMGLHVDLASFAGGRALTFAFILTAVAIVGKQVCALGIVQRGIDRMTVGIGMIPRGEVGLIFAGIGASLSLRGEPIVTKEIFNAVVLMVVVTTMITPPLLAWRFGVRKKAESEGS